MTEGHGSKRLIFPKRRRLTRPSEFEDVKKKGSVERGSFLLLGVLKLTHKEQFRAGFVTSRALGSAVERNRVRRRLREIVRQHQHQIVDGIWVVTVARNRAASAGYRELKAEWLRLANRASILAA